MLLNISLDRLHHQIEIGVGPRSNCQRHTIHNVCDRLLVLGGVELWTWCAYDIVGIAAALGVDAVGNTQCGWCGRPIEVVIREGQPEGNAAVRWLPDESCANVMADFCPSALLFCSQAHLDEWRAREGVGAGEAMDLESLAQRGRSCWGPLVP